MLSNPGWKWNTTTTITKYVLELENGSYVAVAAFAFKGPIAFFSNLNKSIDDDVFYVSLSLLCLLYWNVVCNDIKEEEQGVGF